MMHDVLQPTEIALRRSSSGAHLYAPGSRLKAWVNSQDLLPFAWFLLVDFSLAIAIDDATGHARSGAKKYRTRSRKKVCGRRFKTRSVGLVEAETFFLFGLIVSLCLSLQENLNLLVDRNAYNPRTQQAMALLSEKEISFELIEVRTFCWCDWLCLNFSSLQCHALFCGPINTISCLPWALSCMMTLYYQSCFFLTLSALSLSLSLSLSLLL